MSYILCLETSASYCSVAIGIDEHCKSFHTSSEKMNHGKEVTLLIDHCLYDAGLSPEDLSAVAVSSGPGSYTGLRIAFSCAKGLCYALDIPLIGIETPSIIVHGVSGSENDYDYFIPLIDARRKEVYYSVFDSNSNIIEGIDNMILDTNSFQEYENVIICGDGAEKAEDILNHPSAAFDKSPPSARQMIALAFEKFRDNDFEDTAYFNPIYHKLPNITQSKKALF